MKYHSVWRHTFVSNWFCFSFCLIFVRMESNWTSVSPFFIALALNLWYARAFRVVLHVNSLHVICEV